MTSQLNPTGDLLNALWQSWAERGRQLTPEDWATETRLPGWSVQALFGHVAPDPAMFAQLRDALTEGPAVVTSGAEILRIYNRPGGVAHTAAGTIEEQAREVAEAVSPEQLVRRFAVEAPEAFAELADVPPTAVVAHPILGAVTYGALGEVAVMEATVHLLDLVAAVGGPPPPAAALEATRELLAGVPDPVAFIEAATGRADGPVLPVMR
ncbi:MULTISPECIES: maleylpyruvate isomerase N-terminal domain-containing protein [Kitasatospora]|uniref:Maleylpyruvate isomerase N-terminal domain-containing protein n=1 Tax=Kitasatospora cystarginea TaxID=58350 RepID=A0ABN3E2F2_9ACTN